jgi:hypothetical protein
MPLVRGCFAARQTRTDEHLQQLAKYNQKREQQHNEHPTLGINYRGGSDRWWHD